VDTARAARTAHTLARVGLWGALLTLAILAASVLLRLTTLIDADGAAHSRLPELVETMARLAHRIAAMGVTVIALLAAMIAFTARPAPRGRIAAVALILALTVILAILGRYTPGYKAAAVTLGNVVGGMLLACSFWWLRESAASPAAPSDPRAAALAVIAFVALLVQSALGALSSAMALRGAHDLEALHATTGVALAVLALFAAFPHRNRARTVLPARAVAIAVGFQLAFGAWMALSPDPRPWVLAWLQAMMACVLGLALVCLAVRSRGTGQ